ncbi:MAG: SIMPL domain-containing protein [Acidobacteria bacterium]|nr:SIMPL domain-containing protein [Acidobacteriota bacterium]
MRAVLLAVLIGCIASAASAQTAAPALPIVIAAGEATVKRPPDRASISIAIETRDARPAEARRRNAETMTAVQGIVKGAGVPASAIRTTAFSIAPEMDWRDGKGTLRGYVVRNQIDVRVDDLDRLPELLDALNSPRGVVLSVHGPRFDLKDEPAVQQEALKLAVEAAMSRARAMAAGAGRQLGQILRIEEPSSGGGAPQPMFSMRAAAAPADVQTPIAPGEIEIQARVVLTVELK